MGNIQEYKCPCCGGAIHFDSTIQKMKCPYCDTEFEMEALQGYDEALNQEQPDEMVWDTSAGTEWGEGETNGLHTYQCQSCGGEIVGDESMAASACPYCGNPIVVTGQFSGALKPDYVIPFKLDKKAAKAGLMRHLRGKRLLPKVFKDQNHIDEIKGIYVPFWLFDTDADADIRYRATKVRSWSDKNYNYTETRFFMVARSGNIGFTRVPVDGSTKMEDDLMESIEPFDFKEAVPFADLYGYVAAADIGLVLIQNKSKSYFYSLPNKLFENIQAMTPVIGSDFPGIGGIIDKYEIGIKIKPDSVDDLVNAIEIMRLNPKKYSQFKMNEKKAREELCWQKESRKLAKAIENI